MWSKCEFFGLFFCILTCCNINFLHFYQPYLLKEFLPKISNLISVFMLPYIHGSTNYLEQIKLFVQYCWKAQEEVKDS